MNGCGLHVSHLPITQSDQKTYSKIENTYLFKIIVYFPRGKLYLFNIVTLTNTK